MISKTAAPSVVLQLYDAFASRDAPRLRAALHPEFVGHVSAGMPLGVGGTHTGPDQMLADVWIPVAVAYDVSPIPDDLFVVGPDCIVAVGGYRGTVRGTGAAVDAAFAHVLRLRDGLVKELRQITDTASWPDPH